MKARDFREPLSRLTAEMPLLSRTRTECRAPLLVTVELVEEGLGVLQVGGIEALGEPVVDVGEHRARLVAMVLPREQPSETHRRAQLPRLGALITRNLNRALEAVMSFRGIGITLLEQQLAFEPMYLSFIETLFIFICCGQRFRHGRKPVFHPPKYAAPFGNRRTKHRPGYPGTGGAHGGEAFAQLPDASFRLTLVG